MVRSYSWFGASLALVVALSWSVAYQVAHQAFEVVRTTWPNEDVTYAEATRLRMAAPIETPRSDPARARVASFVSRRLLRPLRRLVGVSPDTLSLALA